MASEQTLKIGLEITELRAGLKDIAASLDRLAKATDQLGQRTTQNFNKAANGTKKVTQDLRALNAEYRKVDKELQRQLATGKKLDQGNKKWKETLGNVRRLREELKKLRQQGATGIDKVTAAQGKLNKQVSLGRQLFLRLRSVMLTVFGAYAIIQGVRNTVSAIAKFELGMARVAAITGATNEELKKLTNSALLAASSGIFSPSKIAEVEVVLAKLGFTVDEIGESIEHISNLSLATGEDLTTSAQLVATTLRGLGLEASQTRHVVDVLGKSFTTSALDVGKYAESIKYLAPIARNMGWTLEDLTAILGVLADNMISGSLAGTGVRQMLIELADSSSDANKVLGRQVETFEDFNELLDKLKENGAGLNEAVNLFNKRSATAVVSLIENTGRLREYRGEMDKTAGAIKEMADRIRVELIPATQNLNASWQAWLNSTMGTGGLADGLNNIKGAIDAVTLANIHNIRTWNTLGQIISKYKEAWVNWFLKGGFDVGSLFRNEGFDLLQTQLESLDENIVLLTSDFATFFDTVATEAREYATLQDRAIFSVGEYNTKLAEIFTTIGERQNQLTLNLQRQREVIEELLSGSISNDRRSELMNELDELKIRKIEIETLIGFYKGIKKELVDNVFTNLQKIDIKILEETFQRLSDTYNQFGMDVKNSPMGEYFRNELLLYQKAIFTLKNTNTGVVEEMTDEQIAVYRDLLNRQLQYELDMASLMEDGLEKEIKIAEIKHKFKKEFSELDIMLARGDRELLQAIYNQMAADVKTHLSLIERIKKKFRDSDVEDAKKSWANFFKERKVQNDREIQQLKNDNATKEEIWKRQQELLIETKEIEILLAEEAGAAADEIRILYEELGLLQDILAGGFDAKAVKGLEDSTKAIANAYKKLASEVLQSLETMADAQVESTERILDDLNNRIAETQRELGIETQLYTEGYANNVTLKRKELADLKEAREQAEIDRAKAVKRQQQLEAISQAINLASAVASTINIYSKIPGVGLAIAAVVAGGFLALFSALQAKSKNLASYGEGGEIDGKPHTRGGVVLEAEGGEFIVNKKQYSKYRSLVNAINNDNLPSLNQSVMNSTSFEKRGDVIVSTKEWGEIRDLLRDNLNKKSIDVVGGKKIITTGIRKRIVNV